MILYGFEYKHKILRRKLSALVVEVPDIMWMSA